MRTMLPFLFVILFSSVLLVTAQNSYNWNPEGGDGLWTDSRWSQPGFPNSTDAVASVDVDFSIGTITVDAPVTVSKLVIGPGCSRLQITQSPLGGSVRLSVHTNPLDTASVSISGTVINQPISISLGDPVVTGRVALVTVRTELGDEVKTFQLTRPSSTEGWFYGTFATEKGPACPDKATVLCVSGPQDITVSYVAPLTGQTHNASFDIACSDFVDFTVSEVEWMLLVDAAQHNYNKLTDLVTRLEGVQYYLNSRSFAENVNHYKAIAQQSFLLGSTCFENYCASTTEFVHKVSMEGGQVPDHLKAPLSRLNPEEQY